MPVTEPYTEEVNLTPSSVELPSLASSRRAGVAKSKIVSSGVTQGRAEGAPLPIDVGGGDGEGIAVPLLRPVIVAEVAARAHMNRGLGRRADVGRDRVAGDRAAAVVDRWRPADEGLAGGGAGGDVRRRGWRGRRGRGDRV